MESTSPTGTTEFTYKIILAILPELEGKVHATHWPERVLLGYILHELVDNDRVIGGLTKTA